MLPIRTYPDSILRKHAQHVDDTGPVSTELLKFVDELFETMEKVNALGLAAPQVGDLRSVFVMRADPKNPRAFINPKITWRSGNTVSMVEGCLSFPEVFHMIVRPEAIRISHFVGYNKYAVEDMDGLDARVFQHEFEHLAGKLFVDRVPEDVRKRSLGGRRR